MAERADREGTSGASAKPTSTRRRVHLAGVELVDAEAVLRILQEARRRDMGGPATSEKD